MGFFSSVRATTSGLSAQRVRMDVIGSNIANMDSTRAANGDGPYRRKVVYFADGARAPQFADMMARFDGRQNNGVVLTAVGEDDFTPNRIVHNPAHPDADEEGYVELPNVNLVDEMTDLTSANRSYQANATVLNSLKQMALRALDLGSR